jgi:O-methyltransferase
MPTEPDPAGDIARIRATLKQRGYAVIHYSDEPIHSYPYDTPWLDDPGFLELYGKIRGHTLVDRVRCYSLHLLARQLRDLPGDVLEIGVWRGGTAGILASNLPDKTVFLADTFEGVIKSSEWEHYKDRAHSDTSIPIVENLLGGVLGVANYRILKGIFPDDTGAAVAGRRWALVHIDVDVYLSAKEAFHAVWEHVVPGGVVVFDDYGFFSACGGIRRFIDEVKDDPDKLFLHNLNAHAYLVKRG